MNQKQYASSKVAWAWLQANSIVPDDLAKGETISLLLALQLQLIEPAVHVNGGKHDESPED